MSYAIDMKECISCHLCVPECPDKGISEINKIYTINKDSCTECIDLGYSQCLNVCPVDCIVLDKNNIESKEELIEKLVKNKQKRVDKNN